MKYFANVFGVGFLANHSQFVHDVIVDPLLAPGPVIILQLALFDQLLLGLQLPQPVWDSLAQSTSVFEAKPVF